VSACPLCSGTNWVLIPDTGEMARCPICYAPTVAKGAVEKSEIRLKFWTATFDAYEAEEAIPDQAKALRAAMDYVAHWPQMKADGRGLALLGRGSGLGKSHLASSICHGLIKGYWTKSVADQDVCLFVNVSEWFGDWAAYWAKFPPTQNRDDEGVSSEEQVLRSKLVYRDRRMFSTELLVLDDLTLFDKEPKRLDRLYALIDHRVANAKPIVVTDNHPTWAQVGERLGDYGPRIVSRLQQAGDMVSISLPLKKKNGGKK